MFAGHDQRADDDLCSTYDLFPTGVRDQAIHDVLAGHDERPGDDERPDDDVLAGDDERPDDDVRSCHNVWTEGLLSTLRVAAFHDVFTGHDQRADDNVLASHDLGTGNDEIGSVAWCGGLQSRVGLPLGGPIFSLAVRLHGHSEGEYVRWGLGVEVKANGRLESASGSTALGATAGVLGAWISAGSVGLWAEPLRVALTWLALLLAFVLVAPARVIRCGLLIGILFLFALPCVVRSAAVGETLFVAAVLGILADGHSGTARRILAVCAYASLLLAVFRLVCLAVPFVWHACDATGAALGALAGRIVGQPLQIGATFAGLDYVVLMMALTTAWFWSSGGRRLVRAAYAVMAIAAGHLIYLVTLAAAQGLSDQLPVPAEPPFVHPYVPPTWQWSAALRQLLPWNVPALAAAVHLAIVAAMLRWSDWPCDEDTDLATSEAAARQGRGPWRLVVRAGIIPLVVAVLLAISSSLTIAPTDLTKKCVVANQTGFLDWKRPRHDEYGEQSAGMFGMLPLLVRSLGGQFRLSSDLTAVDLAAADVVVLLHPADRMSDKQLDRLWTFVRRGGSLLVVSGPYQRDEQRTSRDNDVLRSAGIQLIRDVAISATGNWQHACEPLFHPATSEFSSSANSYFTDAGSSLRISNAARPIVVGRWGWSDPGSDAVLTGRSRFEIGERLGDLVLAAEQKLGQGRLAVVGNSFAFTNEGGVRGYEWTGRLLSHLARGRDARSTPFRGAASLVLSVVLMILLRWDQPRRLALVALLLAGSLSACGHLSRQASRVLPDGRILRRESGQTLRGVAYLDASHVNRYSDLHWGFDGINGLALNLMRDGYLAVTLPEWKRDRLERASLLVSIAPARECSSGERKSLQNFVLSGGIAICTIGAEDARPSRSLLADFALSVPSSPARTGASQREPVPLGHMRSLFLDARDYGAGDYRAGVIFHAAWPVEFQSDEAEVLVRGREDVPLVVARTMGQGRIVLIGDSGFALNKNLEYITGEPFEGGYENAHFWRWLLTRITGRLEWIPPRPVTAKESAEHTAEEKTP